MQTELPLLLQEFMITTTETAFATEACNLHNMNTNHFILAFTAISLTPKGSRFGWNHLTEK